MSDKERGDDPDRYRIYSTGEAAAIIGRSPQHCKRVALLNGVAPRKIGRRGDWMWNRDEVLTVKGLVKKGTWK